MLSISRLPFGSPINKTEIDWKIYTKVLAKSINFKWDKIEVKGGLNLNEFLDFFRKEFKLDVQMINCELVTLYSCFTDPTIVKKRQNMK